MNGTAIYEHGVDFRTMVGARNLCANGQITPSGRELAFLHTPQNWAVLYTDTLVPSQSSDPSDLFNKLSENLTKECFEVSSGGVGLFLVLIL